MESEKTCVTLEFAGFIKSQKSLIFTTAKNYQSVNVREKKNKIGSVAHTIGLFLL
jgi:hypothetical protein